MPDGIENKIAYLHGAKIGDIYGDNYIEISNAGVLSLHGTAKIDDSSDTSDIFKGITVQYDDDNKMVFTTSSVGAGKIAMTGSSDSFEIETGDGKITLTSANGIDVSGVLTLDNKVSWAGYLSGAASASGLLMGVGTSGTPATTSTADAKFVELRCQNTATSGDNRLAYMRFDLAGAGSSGEAIRAFTDLTAAVNTARGAHISLQADDTGYVSGLGAGLDAQLYIGDVAVPAGGTYAALNVEIYSEGASSDISAVTESSFLRFNNGGNATGAGVVDDNTVLFDLNGFTSGTAHLWYDNQGGAPANVEEWIKIRTPAGIRYLAVYNAVV
jgi:hypothetical protein